MRKQPGARFVDMHIAVIGGGVIGLATTRALVAEGHEVSCYDPAPACGASSGRGRIFRHAHETAPLVLLAQEAGRKWAEWERRAAKTFIAPVGFLLAGEGVAQQYGRAMSEAAPPAEPLTATRGQAKLPWLRIEEACLWDQAGGAIDSASVMSWLLAETQKRFMRELVKTVATTDEGAEVNGRAYDRALICAGPGTVALAAQVGLSLPGHHARHARFSLRVPSGQWPSFIDHQMPVEPLGAYGVPLEHDVYAVGVGWADPTCAADWTAERMLAYQASCNDEYRGRTCPSAGISGEYVTCHNNHLPFPTGRQFAVWRAGNVFVFGGNDLFKFAPLLGDDLAEVLAGRPVPSHLAPVEWSGDPSCASAAHSFAARTE